MKHFFKLTILASVVTALIFGLSAFTSGKNAGTDAYSISLLGKCVEGNNETWTWSLVNPNPGNGDNGSLQDVSHLSLPLTASAEAAMVSAEYSRDGVTWTSISISMDRDPAIKQCTNADVLKYDIGTIGSEPLYYRITFDDHFETNTWATCYIKTGGGRNGCNLYYYHGVAGPKLD